MTKIALIGEFDPNFAPHAATEAAIAHASAALGLEVSSEWISTADLNESQLAEFAGLWVVPGSPYKNLKKTLWAIQQAREQNIPCLGTCGGFQHMILEYARNVLGFEDAHHAEYDPYASNLFISELTCSLAGRDMRLNFVPGSRMAAIYNADSAVESYYCNFGVNPDKIDLLKSGALQITAADAEGEIRAIELPNCAFFIGTLFVPQLRSKPGKPHLLISAFVSSVVEKKNSRKYDAF